jgi:hypothetical protein
MSNNNMIVAVVINLILKRERLNQGWPAIPFRFLAAAVELCIFEFGFSNYKFYTTNYCSEPEEGVRIRNYAEEVVISYSISTFKMTPTAFEAVLNAVGRCPEMIKRHQMFGGRNQIGVEKILLVAVWALATPESYRSIGDRFDIVKSTVYYCIKRTVAALLNNICKKVISWPKIEDREQIGQGFNRYGLEHCIGAIDGCHIAIKAPSTNSIDYINRKKFHSVILQGVCDSRMFFTDCDIRWPGSVHDARVLRNSDLFHAVHESFQPEEYIIGDAAYPCLEWIIPPFKNNGRLTPQQVHFNKQLSSTRNVIERAFALLKGRFRRLKMLEMYDIHDTNRTILACCVLHNICLQHEEDVEEYIQENLHEEVPNVPYIERNNAAEGRFVRQRIVDQLWRRHIQNR